jgi:hypothetical protein
MMVRASKVVLAREELRDLGGVRCCGRLMKGGIEEASTGYVMDLKCEICGRHVHICAVFL